MKRFTLLAAASLMIGASAQAAPSMPKIRPQAQGVMASVKASKTEATGRKLAPVAKKKAMSRVPSLNVPGPTAAQQQVITEAPAGTRGYYAKEGVSFGNEYGVIPYESTSDGYAADIVLTEDNKIYMAPAFTEGVETYGTSYIVGDVKDGVATFTFPQAIYYGMFYDEDYNTFMDYDYALMMEYYETEDGYWDLVPSSEQTISFNIAADGTLTPAVNDPYSFIAAAWWFPEDAETSEYTYGGWYWALLGDNYTSLTPIKDTPAALPAGVTPEQWNVINGKQGYAAGVAISGSDIYLTGLYQGMPDGVMAGKIEGDKAVFPAVNFLGVDPVSYEVVYAQGAEWKQYQDPDNGMMEGLQANGEEIVFTYDAAAGKLTGEGAIAFSMVADKTIALNAGLQNPVICKSSGKEITEINKPVIMMYQPYDDEEGFGMIAFSIDNVINETDVISADKLYFSIYMNEEVFAFDPEDYYCFNKPETEIPYGFVDESESGAIEFYDYYNMELVGFMVDGISTIGVQAIYKDGDKVVKSEIVTINGEEPFEGDDEDGDGDDDGDDEEDTITEITSDSAATYFDLQGRRVAAPAAGQLLVKKTAAGAVKVRF
ncbi:MAG: hypothetical protein HDS33_04130 [Bacteroides sp.]|nr:hypothetical protein [Bacteroides sp.]